MNTYEIEWNGQSYRAADITIFAGKEDELNVMIADMLVINWKIKHLQWMIGLPFSYFLTSGNSIRNILLKL